MPRSAGASLDPDAPADGASHHSSRRPDHPGTSTFAASSGSAYNSEAGRGADARAPASQIDRVEPEAAPLEKSPPVAVPAAGAAAYRRRWVVLAALAGAVILAGLIVRADVAAIAVVLRQIHPTLLLLPALATLGSYVTMARSYQGIAEAAGRSISFKDMFRITLVANTANYLLSTGGLSGFALRFYLFTRRGIPAGSAVLISLVQTILTNLVLLLFVIAGFALLLTSHALVGKELVAAAALLLAFSVVVLATAVAMVRPGLRRRLLTSGTRLVEWGADRFGPARRPSRASVRHFEHTLDAGFTFLLERPRAMVMPTVYIVLDWVFTLLVLQTAFIAIGYPIPASYVIAGFAIGMFLSIVSLIPGGLGILDGSMAAVFASLGVPLERAVVAILIFRVAYYALPLLASLLFARPTFQATS
jgi:uncharacterized protein (TIRG00374 family)